MTNTYTMTGNSTGYGAASGSEIFNLSGTNNDLLLAGAADTVNITGGQNDSIDLNSSGFTGATTDSINLGLSSYNTVMASHALFGSNLTIDGASGPNQVSLVNHYGVTSVSLGYTGDAATEHGSVPQNLVTLNGDATNTIAFEGTGDATVAVGTGADGLFGYSTSIALSGLYNSIFGGDENFTVADTTGGLNSIVLGNGNNTLALAGGQDTVALGTGNNVLSLASLGSVIAFAQGGAGSNDVVNEKGCDNRITAGDENVSILGTISSVGYVKLGNGNDVLNVVGGGGTAVFGTSTANTATDSATVGRSDTTLTFNGGVDQVLLKDSNGHGGGDKITLNGTMLGTALTAHGIFDKILLTSDANAAITDGAVNGAMSITIDGDAHGGMGNISISGLATDDLAHIHLKDLSAYTITADSTPAGGVTLHFSQGSIDLIGMQVLPNNLFS